MWSWSKINILLDKRRMGSAFSLSVILLWITSFSLIAVPTSLFACVFVAARSSCWLCDSLQPIVNVLLTALRVFFPCPPHLLPRIFRTPQGACLFYKHRNKPENMVSSGVRLPCGTLGRESLCNTGQTQRWRHPKGWGCLRKSTSPCLRAQVALR